MQSLCTRGCCRNLDAGGASRKDHHDPCCKEAQTFSDTCSDRATTRAVRTRSTPGREPCRSQCRTPPCLWAGWESCGRLALAPMRLSKGGTHREKRRRWGLQTALLSRPRSPAAPAPAPELPGTRCALQQRAPHHGCPDLPGLRDHRHGVRRGKHDHHRDLRRKPGFKAWWRPPSTRGAGARTFGRLLRPLGAGGFPQLRARSAEGRVPLRRPKRAALACVAAKPCARSPRGLFGTSARGCVHGRSCRLCLLGFAFLAAFPACAHQVGKNINMQQAMMGRFRVGRFRGTPAERPAWPREGRRLGSRWGGGCPGWAPGTSRRRCPRRLVQILRRRRVHRPASRRPRSRCRGS